LLWLSNINPGTGVFSCVLSHKDKYGVEPDKEQNQKKSRSVAHTHFLQIFPRKINEACTFLQNFFYLTLVQFISSQIVSVVHLFVIHKCCLNCS
jgi:hypothetical protein